MLSFSERGESAHSMGVIKSTAFMTASTLARLLTSVVVFVVMARFWGANAFGIFAYPLTIATVAVMVVDYGFGLQVVRSIGGRPDSVHEVTQRALAAKCILSLLVAAAALVATPLVADGVGTVALIWLLLLSSLLSSFALLLNLPFRGLGRFEEETKVVVLASVVHFAVVVVALVLGAGPLVVGVCFVLSRTGYWFLSLSAYRELVGRVEWRGLDVRSGLAMLKEGLPYGVFVAMGTLYFQVDTLIAQHFLGPRGVGLFQAGVRLLMGALIVPDVMCNVYLPAIAGAVGRDKSRSAHLAGRMTRHLLMFGVIGLAVFALGADWIVPGLFGRDYQPVVALLPLFGLVLLLRFAASSYGLLLTIGDRQVTRTVVVCGAFLLSLAVNVVLIPLYGLRGAVLASVATHVFLVSSYLWFVVRAFGTWFLDLRSACLVVLAGVVGTIVSSTAEIRLWGGLAIVVVALALGVKSNEWRTLSRTLAPLGGEVEAS